MKTSKNSNVNVEKEQEKKELKKEELKNTLGGVAPATEPRESPCITCKKRCVSNK